jgi:hypothetical protein
VSYNADEISAKEISGDDPADAGGVKATQKGTLPTSLFDDGHVIEPKAQPAGPQPRGKKDGMLLVFSSIVRFDIAWQSTHCLTTKRQPHTD